MSRDTAVRVGGLTKFYGSSKVLNNVDLELKKGEFATFFGPNGAGKTTLIKILSTLVSPDKGEVYINGCNLKKEPREIRKVVGVVSHEHFLYHNLTVAENMRFFGELYGICDLSEKITFNLQKLGIYSKKKEFVRNLSNGMKQRVAIARSVLHEPLVLLFDEPFVGLDKEGISLLMDIFKEFKQDNKTVIITTHNARLGLKNCDTVFMLNKGSVEYTKPANEVAVGDVEGK